LTDSSSNFDSKSKRDRKVHFQNDELVVEFQDLIFTSKVNRNDLNITIQNLRDKLDEQTDNIELKEEIILNISNN